MSRPQQTSTWPFLLVLACLFMLSVLGPRSWQKIAVVPSEPSERESIGANLREAKPREPKSVATMARQPKAQPARAAAAHAATAEGVAKPKRPRPEPRKTSLRPQERIALREPAKDSAKPRAIQAPLLPLEPSEPQGKIMSQVKARPATVASEPKTTREAAATDTPSERAQPDTTNNTVAAREQPPANDAQLAAPSLAGPREVAARRPLLERVATRDERKPERPDLRLPTQAPAAAPKSPQQAQGVEGQPRSQKQLAAAPQPAGFWALPEVLMANLERLSLDCDATEWATQTSELIRELCRLERPDAPRAQQILAELRGLVSSAHPLRAALTESPSAAPWRRIVHALARRLEIWQLAPRVAQTSRELRPPDAAERSRLSSCLAEVAAMTRSDPSGAAWRQYLQLETLQALAERRLDVEGERRLALRTLDKLERAAFDERQRQFIATSPLAALDRELHHWIAEPVDPRRLLSTLERFETSGLPSDARDLAICVRQVTAWPSDVAPQAEHWLDENYRNSNLRMAISKEFFNRMVPKQDPIQAPVRDRILGVPTRGWSTTTADLGIQLIPDPHRVRLSLQVQGLVKARTTSRSGPATFYSNSDAEYLAFKEITVGLAGVHTQPAHADASNNPQLQDVETDYDIVPLLGLVIEGVARVKHAEQESAVRRIARQRVTSRVQEELDSMVEAKLKESNAQFQQRVLAPLKRLQLEPSVIAMQTGEDRVTLRLRMATDEQLAANTPRPQALADSLASVQIHQSLLNNVCEQLQLDGRTFSLPELQQHLASVLGLNRTAFSEKYPEEMRITFAPHDSVQVRFTSGRVMVTLAVAELRNYPNSWRDFKVRAFYKPVRHGLDLKFVRDGTVQLWGERFGAQPQIALRGIFNRIFSQDRQLSVLDPKLATDPRLAGLEVTQCLTTDGWLGLSIGEAAKRRGHEARTAAR